MHFTLLALQAVFVAAIAAPTSVLDTASLSQIDDVVSDLDSTVPELPEKRQLGSGLDTADLSAADLSIVDDVVAEVESTVPELPTKRQLGSALDTADLSTLDDVVEDVEASVPPLPESSLPVKRQAEPLVDLLDGLLATISPVAGQVGKSHGQPCDHLGPDGSS